MGGDRLHAATTAGDLDHDLRCTTNGARLDARTNPGCRWNDAANAGAGAGSLTGLGDGATRGTNWGMQLETRF